MWKIFKKYGCQPTQQVEEEGRIVMARAAINIGNTTEETVKVDEINPLPVEETEPAENTEK